MAKTKSPSEDSPSAPPDDELVTMLKYLRLGRLLSHWDETLQTARQGRWSSERLLKYVLEEEYRAKRENARLLRRQRANIPAGVQPLGCNHRLNRLKPGLQQHDGFDYMTRQRGLVWMGPTGCGKTGLATAFLLQAIDRGYRGYFVTVPELLQELFRSLADRSEEKVLRRYVSYDCLVIDEVGYVEVEPAQVGQFFTLMHKRHQKKTTLITTNLGFAEWGSFLRNAQLTSALLDRLTATCHVVNMKDCVSLREKLA